MEINSPVIAIYADGNQKDRAKKLAFTRVADYDAIKKETRILFVAPLLSSRQQERKLKASVKKTCNKAGIYPTRIDYHALGADIIQLANNN